MLKRLIQLIIILAGCGASVYADIYKCPDDIGGVVYSEVPCPDGSILERDDARQTPRLPQGLRESEKTLLRELDERDQKARQTREASKQREAAAPEAADTRTCSGITLTRLTTNTYSVTYTDELDIGLLVRRRGFRHCASAGINLTGYYGYIREALARDLRERLYAVLADGSAVFAETVELSDGPGRIGLQAEFNARFCFEPVEYQLVDIVCR